MVLFEIDDKRIEKLFDSTLRCAFRNEMKKKHEIFGEDVPDEALDNLFRFYARYVARVRLEDRPADQGLACAPMDPGLEVKERPDGNRLVVERQPEKGEIKLLLSASMREQYSDDEIIGMIAHELGHLYNQFHYGEAFEVRGLDKTELEDERDADDAARDLGFEKEIQAMRAKIPLPSAR